MGSVLRSRSRLASATITRARAVCVLSHSRTDSWCAALQRIGKQIQHGQLVWRGRPLLFRHVGVEDLRPEPTFSERFLDDGSSDGLPVAERIIILLALRWSPVWREDVRLSE